MLSKKVDSNRNTPVLEYSQLKDKITVDYPPRFEYSETKDKLYVNKIDRSEINRCSLSYSSHNTVSEGRSSFKPNSVRLEKKTIANFEESEIFDSRHFDDIDNEELDVVIWSNYALNNYRNAWLT